MARLIEKVIGHEHQIQRLLSLRQSDRWPHALMFVGPRGIGKKKVALAVAQMLICPNDPQACGVCGPCLRVERQQSESLTLITPDPELVKEVIKVDAIRELLDSLSLASLGGARVVIIDQADRMNPQAANALLKTLEEPFENVYFILTGHDLHSFLPTIRSRTQPIRFFALSEAELRQIKPGQPDWAYRSSRGQVAQLQLLTSPDGLAQREDALTLFEQFCDDSEFLLSNEWRGTVKDRGQALTLMKYWMQFVRDLLVLKTPAPPLILNLDQSARFAKLGQIRSKKLLQMGENLIQAERDLKGNAEPVLVFEDLWVQYARMD